MTDKSNSDKSSSGLPEAQELKCQDCGMFSSDVKQTICPYAEDINNSKVEIVVCPACYHERCKDV